MAWQINSPGQAPTGLPKVRPQKLSRLLGQNPKLCTENLTLGLLSPSLRPAWVILQPLYSGPMATSGKQRAFWGFSPFFYKSGSVLAPRLCPVEGKEGEREGKKRFPPYCSAAGKLLSSVLSFICGEWKKNVEKFGEINLSALLGALALPCLPLASPLPCSQGLSTTSPLGTRASMGLGLGLRWGRSGVVLGLGLF